MATSPATDVHFEQRALLRYPPRSIPRSTLHEIKLTRACDLFKKRNFSRQPRSLVSNSIAGICFSCKIRDSVVETLIWNILSVQKMWLRIIKDIYKDCRDVRIFKMECWIYFRNYAHWFFFLIIVKGLLRSRILRSIFENYYTWLTFPLHIIFFSFVFCKEFIIS